MHLALSPRVCYSASGVNMVEEQAKNEPNSTGITLTVRACVIRDSTLGISLFMGGELIGEWTDSRAQTLSLTDEGKVAIQGATGEPLYLFSVPGKLLSCEQVSDTEVTITFEPWATGP
jgi:hypothetical protein